MIVLICMYFDVRENYIFTSFFFLISFACLMYYYIISN